MRFNSPHKPRRRFGQNFLQDRGVIEKILASLCLVSNDRLLEIGPGLGALTKPLLERVNHLDVVEIDRDLAKQLSCSLPSQHKLTIHNQDMLTFDLQALNMDLANQQKLRIVGNLPYNITTPLLFHLFKFAPLIEDMHFMLQKEVADRITASPNGKDYGRLSIMTQYFCHASLLFTVPPEAFFPAPKVHSAWIRLVPCSFLQVSATNNVLLESITRVAFTQRRKTLANALKSYLTLEDFARLAIDPGLRPEALSLQDFIRISQYVDALPNRYTQKLIRKEYRHTK